LCCPLGPMPAPWARSGPCPALAPPKLCTQSAITVAPTSVPPPPGPGFGSEEWARYVRTYRKTIEGATLLKDTAPRPWLAPAAPGAGIAAEPVRVVVVDGGIPQDAAFREMVADGTRPRWPNGPPAFTYSAPSPRRRVA